MFTKYDGLTDEQIDALCDQSDLARLQALLLIVHGIRKNILTQEDGLRQINNLTISLLEA